MKTKQITLCAECQKKEAISGGPFSLQKWQKHFGTNRNAEFCSQQCIDEYCSREFNSHGGFCGCTACGP